MSLWSKTEQTTLGSFDIENGVATPVTPADFDDIRNVVKVGDIAVIGGVSYTVAAVTQTTFTLSDTLVTSSASTVYLKNTPSWVNDAEYALTLSVVTTEDAQTEVFRSAGLKTPGWVRSVTFDNQNGVERNITEVLAVFKNTEIIP